MGRVLRDKSTVAVRDVMTKSIGREICRLRRERGLSGWDLGQLLQMSQQQVSRYECGACHLTVDLLLVILKVLDVPLMAFFRDVYSGMLSPHLLTHELVHYHRVFMPADKPLPSQGAPWAGAGVKPLSSWGTESAVALRGSKTRKARRTRGARGG